MKLKTKTKTKNNTYSLAGNIWTNLGSDITLLTKVRIAKAMVFPVVWMWELDHEEDWELKNLNCSTREESQESLGQQEFKPVLKEINPEYSLEGLLLKLKLQYFGCVLRRADSLEKILILGKIEGRRRRGQQRMRWVDSITNLMGMNLSKLQEVVEDRGAWHAAVHGATRSRTQLSDWTLAMGFILGLSPLYDSEAEAHQLPNG